MSARFRFSFLSTAQRRLLRAFIAAGAEGLDVDGVTAAACVRGGDSTNVARVHVCKLRQALAGVAVIYKPRGQNYRLRWINGRKRLP
jgi:hypothetical protein